MSDDVLRTADGKKIGPSVEQWLQRQAHLGISVAQFKIFDPEEEIVIEGWKTVEIPITDKNFSRLIVKMRRPQDKELEEWKVKADAKGRLQNFTRGTKEFLGRMERARVAEIRRKLN